MYMYVHWYSGSDIVGVVRGGRKEEERGQGREKQKEERWYLEGEKELALGRGRES